MVDGRNFESGAYRDQNANKLDWSGFLSPNALRLFAEYMHRNRLQSDGRMRGSDNWKLGIPIPSYKESLIRHVFEFWMEWDKAQARYQIIGNKTERARMIECLCGAMFNLQGILHELEKLDEQDKNIPGATGTVFDGKASNAGAALGDYFDKARYQEKVASDQNWGKGQIKVATDVREISCGSTTGIRHLGGDSH